MTDSERKEPKERAEKGPRERAEKAPRPSQAEGEGERSGGQPRGAAPEEGDVPRPSQAEGELEDVEENLRRQEQDKKG